MPDTDRPTCVVRFNSDNNLAPSFCGEGNQDIEKGGEFVLFSLKGYTVEEKTFINWMAVCREARLCQVLG